MSKRGIHVLHGCVNHLSKFGDVLWQSGQIDNILHDEGEQYILAQSFATTRTGFTTVTQMHFGLDNRASLAEADTLATCDATEPKTAGGYSRKAVGTGGTGAAGQPFVFGTVSNYWQAQGTTVTWTASGAAWATMKNLFMCTTSTGTTGKLICSLALTATRTLQVDDVLNASMYVGLSE